MDNEKLNNEELETVEPIEEVEETVEEEAVETTEAEEISEDTEETVEAVEVDENGEVIVVDGEELEVTDECIKPGISGGKVGAIIGGIVAIVIALAAILWYTGILNPYEIGYVDVSGMTLEEIADQSGYSLKEYKKVNGLPWLMPKSTNENAVGGNRKLKAVIAQSGMAFEDFKEYYGWGDNITENSTVGKALGETKLSVVLGVKDMEEDMANQTLAAFKDFYGFGDDVTLDTLYKDVRVEMDKKAREQRIEQEKAAEEADEEKPEDEEAEVETSDVESEPETEEPAEEPEAEEEAAEEKTAE